jgi:hypothetical protein
VNPDREGHGSEDGLDMRKMIFDKNKIRDFRCESGKEACLLVLLGRGFPT